jgi:uncharacterized protein (DUF2147 family)
MNSLKFLIGLAVMAIAAPVFAADAPGVPAAQLWLNPHNNVAVRTGACGAKLCGWIVWANPEALADARDAGLPQLIGTELLENYQAKGRGSWAGRVFVPDMNRHFYSTIDVVSPTQLRIAGCILGGLICKSQVWTRIGQLSHV